MKREAFSNTQAVHNSVSNQLTLQLINLLADWLDTKFRIPGTQIRFGLDAILGLFPIIGNALSSAISLMVFALILLKGVPVTSALKMMFNILIDTILSLIPFVGVIFDIGYKANTRNLSILSEHLQHNHDGKYYLGVWLVFLLTVFILLALLFWLGIFLGKFIISLATTWLAYLF